MKSTPKWKPMWTRCSGRESSDKSWLRVQENGTLRLSPNKLCHLVHCTAELNITPAATCQAWQWCHRFSALNAGPEKVWVASGGPINLHLIMSTPYWIHLGFEGSDWWPFWKPLSWLGHRQKRIYMTSSSMTDFSDTNLQNSELSIRLHCTVCRQLSNSAMNTQSSDVMWNLSPCCLITTSIL